MIRERWALVAMLCVTLFLIGLTGCGGRQIEANRETEYRMQDIAGYAVRDFKLTDGTRCVIVSGGGNGITCAWKP